MIIRYGLTEQLIETIKCQAIDSVLRRQGEQMFDVLQFHLKRYHRITFDPRNQQNISLEHFHKAMCELVGERAASLLLEDIYVELDQLSDMHMNRTK